MLQQISLQIVFNISFERLGSNTFDNDSHVDYPLSAPFT